jgi:hypothetical protein
MTMARKVQELKPGDVEDARWVSWVLDVATDGVMVRVSDRMPRVITGGALLIDDEVIAPGRWFGFVRRDFGELTLDERRAHIAPEVNG